MMQTSQPIVIPLSKNKLALLFTSAVVFVALGVGFVAHPPTIQNPIIGNPTRIFIVGLLSIIFFGAGGIFIFKKLWDNSPGLIVTDIGIFDNSGAGSSRFIQWVDILDIQEKVVQKKHFVNIVLKNPQQYIDNQKSAIKRKLMQINYNSFGTVIGISASGLKCSYDELKAMLDNKFNDYKSKNINL